MSRAAYKTAGSLAALLDLGLSPKTAADKYEAHGHPRTPVGSVPWHFHNYEHGYQHCTGSKKKPYNITEHPKGHLIDVPEAVGHGRNRKPIVFRFPKKLDGGYLLESGEPKTASTSQAFFLPTSTRPAHLPALTKDIGKYWHTGIVHNGQVYETFNQGKYRVSSIQDRLPALVAQKADFLPVKIDTAQLHKNIKSGTSCDEFVLRATGHSERIGADKGDKYPTDVHRILSTKTAALQGKSPEFAPGIPKGKPISRLPAISPQTLNRWTLAVQEHEAERAGKHFDLRLVDPDAGKAHSWAIPKARLPEPGEKLLAVQTFTHTPEYALNFGAKKPETIGQGYGKGRVRMAIKEPTDIIDSSNDHVRFNIYQGKNVSEYLLRRTHDDKWLLHNVTATKDTAGIPQSKPKYKETSPDKIDVTDDSQLMMAKIDGAHNTFRLDANKPVRIFSYRPSERDTGVIEHTHRFLPGLTTRVPEHLNNLVLRGELFASDPHTGQARQAVETGAVLNSNVWKSRDTQTHAPLRAVVFDVARRNGQNVEAIPYQEKLDVLKKVHEALPFLELPPMAETAKDKVSLLNRIRTGQEPTTREGVVLWPLQGGAPIKAKFKPDHDVFVREIFPEEGKRKSLAGGFAYSWSPQGKIVGRVGTGFNHELKQDMLENPQKYIGRVAKVNAQDVYRDPQNMKKPGALRAPAFLGWHLDKGLQPFEEKTADILKTALNKFKRMLAEYWKNVKAMKPFSPESIAARESLFAQEMNPHTFRINAAIPQYMTPMTREQVAQHRLLTQRKATGAHLPQADETLIRGTLSGNDVARPTLERTPYLYRGNPIDEGPAFLTRHPDVAAGYASGRAWGPSADRPTRQLFVYPRENLTSLGEGPADLFYKNDVQRLLKDPEARAWRQATGEGWQQQRKFEQSTSPFEEVREYRGHSGRVVPTYEAVIDTRAGIPSPVGTYRVRPSRTAEGDIAYAVRPITGPSVEQVFPTESILQRK